VEIRGVAVFIGKRKVGELFQYGAADTAAITRFKAMPVVIVCPGVFRRS
jgi:hypothetical protein